MFVKESDENYKYRDAFRDHQDALDHERLVCEQKNRFSDHHSCDAVALNKSVIVQQQTALPSAGAGIKIGGSMALHCSLGLKRKKKEKACSTTFWMPGRKRRNG